MAKTRAQRKAERRKRAQREAELQKRARQTQVEAQQHTQVPESGEVAEAEAVMRTGGQPEELGETVRRVEPEEEALEQIEREVEPQTAVAEAEPTEPEAPAPSRADVGAPVEEAPPGETRRERRRRERAEAKAREERRKARERGAVAEREERQRGPVLSFLNSVAAELRRVQWPDRETLVQASAVTLLFVTVAALYLGALDLVFNWLVQRIV